MYNIPSLFTIENLSLMLFALTIGGCALFLMTRNIGTGSWRDTSILSFIGIGSFCTSIGSVSLSMILTQVSFLLILIVYRMTVLKTSHCCYKQVSDHDDSLHQ